MSPTRLGIGRAPLTNLYESLVFFAWTIAVIYLILERKFKIKTVGAFVTPFPFIIMAYASLNPNEIQPLVPALKSNWLIAHVVTCFVGYAAFAVSFGVSILYLFKVRAEHLAAKSPGLIMGYLPGLRRAGRDRLQDDRHRVSALDDRHRHRRLLGQCRLGNLLELGSQRNLVADRLVYLCGLSARQDYPRLAGNQGGDPVHRRFQRHDLLLSRRKPDTFRAA